MNASSLFLGPVPCPLATIRADLLRACRATGATAVEATYDGYGDSGNIEDLAFVPTRIVPLGATGTRLADFLWQMAYDRHPGFENNEGGYGEVRWDLEADTISIDHAERYVEVSHTYSEGL